MKRLYFLLSLLLLIVGSDSFGQGIIRGKITDENGEMVVGATVVLKENPTYGSISDFDGNYELKITTSEPQTLVISYISFETIEQPVNPKNDEVLIQNFILRTSAQAIKEVEVSAKAIRSRDFYMEKVKMNSATSIDYISSETIKKTGDSYVVGAVQRVSGVSTNRSGFITVRGIGDRYIKTTLNKAQIPTLDPFTNNIRLDIFPTSLVDNVVISKTATADLPGDWAGAYINVITKDYPDQLQVSVETSFGYNTQSTFQEIISSRTSSTDWLGYDDGFRDINHDEFIQVNESPTQYEEMVALGLGSFYESLGVTESWLAGSNTGEAYFKLGLVELGLLPPALINDPAAVAAAKNTYISGGYKNDAFGVINTAAAESGKKFANNWETFYEKAPIDFSQNFSIGNQTKLFGKPLGFLFGFRYANQYRYDPESQANRAVVDAQGNNDILWSAEQEVSSVSHGWSGLANLSYKINNNNSVSVLFMPNQTGINRVRDAEFTRFSETYDLTLRKTQFYDQRRQLIYQIRTEHYIPGPKVKIDFSGSYTDGDNKAPDFKDFIYFADIRPDGTIDYVVDNTESDTHRYFRYLKEDMFDTKLSAEIPVKEEAGLTRKIRIGGSFLRNDRESQQYDYTVIYNEGNNVPVPDNDLEPFFAEEDFGLSVDSTGNYVINKYHTEPGIPANHTIGYNQVIGGFAMFDYNINPLWRVSAGLRVEYAEVYSDVYEYDRLGYAADDPRRQFPGEILTVKPGELKEWSYLPSANIVYKLRYDERAPVNLRLNYSQSVARPSIRELSDALLFDYEVQDFVFGNSDLKMVRISNYDARLEYYFRSGDNASVSLFYKDFKDHIELVNSNQGFTWQNVDDSEVFGIEIEGRKKLGKHFEFMGNLTLVESKTDFVKYRLEIRDSEKEFIPVDTVSRTMFGQAPYVINAMLTYRADSIGLVVSLSYNRQGEKLVFTSIDGTPDIFEQPRDLIDLKVSKTIGRYFGVSLKVRNILNAPIIRAYNYTDSTDLDFDKFAFGTNFVLGFSYNLR